MHKITVVGSGRVGESTALFLAQQHLAKEVVLLDVRGEYAAGTALDIQETAPLFRFDTRLIGTADASQMKGSDIVVVTAGLPRKPGMSRSDVLETNINIIDTIVQDVVKHAPNAILLIVSNPVDSVTYRAFIKTGWPRERVFGQAGVLDAARMATFVAMETGLSAKDIQAMVMGGHGDAMVPMIRYTTVNGISVEQFLKHDQIERIIDRTRKGGAEVLQLKQNSSAYQAPAAAVVDMVDAIVHDRHRVLPTVAILQGEYGESDIAMGVPVMLGKKGLEKIIELPLNTAEKKMFDESIRYLRVDLEHLAKMA